MGCGCTRCRRARAHPGVKRYPSSLALVIPEGGSFLLDATPRMPEQLDLLAESTDGTSPQPDGILLTHAHIGHYAGLMYLGKEVMSARGVPVYCTPSMALFLARNAPWSCLIDDENIQVKTVVAGETFHLGGDVRASAFAVPHRDEHSDTVGYLIQGTRASLLYMPDLDAWEGFAGEFNGLLERTTYAFIDGTFFSEEELPAHRDRGMQEVPHPPVAETLRLFEAGLLRAGTAKVFFTHFNHTNPLLEDGDARRAVLNQGLGLAAEGQTFWI